MKRGKPFEVSKEVYDRAAKHNYFMTEEDKVELFSSSIRNGYGLYNCRVQESDGKYICTYSVGDSCD